MTNQDIKYPIEFEVPSWGNHKIGILDGLKATSQNALILRRELYTPDRVAVNARVLIGAI
jgi:hypothetical protein